jgi:hypothetical protein
LTPGAALVFLIGGPGVSASTLIAVQRLMGWRAMLVYVLVLALCAIAFGYLMDSLLPAGWLPPGIQAADHCAHGETGMGWTTHVWAALLLGIIGWAKWGPRKRAAHAD